MMKLSLDAIDSPLGPVAFASGDDGLVALDFSTAEALKARVLARRPGASFTPGGADIARRLRAYFAGRPRALDELEVAPGGSPFQQRVWRELRRIPPGRTLSYSALAAAIGHPTAVRAVGAANGANPVPLVVPCHRVISATGGLGGYACGLDRKAWLLRHEGASGQGELSLLAG